MNKSAFDDVLTKSGMTATPGQAVGCDFATNYMTGAELQTMREACHLSRDDLAGLVRVQARTVKHWENGRSGVPGDVAAVMRNIDQHATDMARHALGELLAMQAQAAPGQVVDLVLLRYRRAADLHQALRSFLAAGAEGLMVRKPDTGYRPGRSGAIVKLKAHSLPLFEQCEEFNF
jgi:DNA-binding transcriptional regulator YiaG